LALTARATWLGTVLVIDAVISPGGTGLVYLGTTARISYALGDEREMPSALNRTDRRSVPVTSGFGFANPLIYWTGWDFIWKLDILSSSFSS
jgi:amino acid transporter